MEQETKILTAEQEQEMELYGCVSESLTIPASALAQFRILRDYKFRDIPEKHRISVLDFAAQQILEAASKASEYAENQAYLKAEKLVFKYAKDFGMTPAQAAEKFKFQFRDQK